MSDATAIRIAAESRAALRRIEPGNLAWKEKLKGATRRIRLLAVYTPDDFRTIQEAETKERE